MVSEFLVLMKRTFLVALVLLVAGPTVVAQDDSDEEEGADQEMEELSVVGVRNPNRSAVESTALVEIIDSAELDNLGSTDLLDQLGAVIPSMYVERFAIADAATIIRPPSIRGLPSDATLVLINGKRRHRGSIVALLVAGTNTGSQGPDLTAIPSIALDRVEVLQDGASAQYGSDAIAGVLNFVLKEKSEGANFQLKTGQFYEGDGSMTSVAGIVGLPLFSDAGFFTLSMELNAAEPTVRSVQRDDAAGLIANGNTAVRQPYAQIWGSPQVHYDFRIFFNGEIEFGDNQTFYTFGNYSGRDVEGGFYYRNPNTRSGVFTGDNGATLLVADLTPNDGIPCPVVPITNQQVPDADALAAVLADPNCWTIADKFPGGFTPQFGGEVSDNSLAAGFKGMLLNGWNYDLSFVMGYSGVFYYMLNTINPQLVARKNNIPTEYHPGDHEQLDLTFNVELSRFIEVASGYGDVHLATGFEARRDRFIQTQGEDDSWFVDPDIAAQGFGIGSNGFPGFPPSANVDGARLSWALWADAEQDLTSNILGSLAVRFESYEGFGTTLDFKVASRIEFTDDFSVRLGYNTGFIAPTVAQQNIRIVSTNFLISPICPTPGIPCLADEVTLPPSDPLAVLKGAQGLSPIRSRDISIGFNWTFQGFNTNVGYYHVDVNDRIARTSAIAVTNADYNTLQAQGHVVDRSLSAIRFFTNDFDTTTEGIEISMSRSVNWGDWFTDFSWVANYTKTSVEHFNPFIINLQRKRELEEAIPRLHHNLTAVHTINDQFSGMTRLRYYGEMFEAHLFTDTLPITIDPAFLLDVELKFKPSDGISLVFGMENALDTYPEDNPYSGIAGAAYPLNSAYGFNGGFTYFRVAFQP